MGDKVKTRSSSVADEAAISLAKQMDLYVTNSVVFKQAIASKVQETVLPLQVEIASLKSDLINLRSQLVEAKAKSNDDEQCSLYIIYHCKKLLIKNILVSPSSSVSVSVSVSVW